MANVKRSSRVGHNTIFKCDSAGRINLNYEASSFSSPYLIAVQSKTAVRSRSHQTEDGGFAPSNAVCSGSFSQFVLVAVMIQECRSQRLWKPFFTCRSVQ